MVETPVAIGIVAHPARAEQATRLADRVGADVVRFDHDGEGEQANHAATLQLLIENTRAPWLILLEDDAIPVHDFHQRVADDLTHLPPRHLVSGYLGTGRGAGIPPARWTPMIRRLLDQADSRGDRYIHADAMWHAVAIALPRHAAPSLHNHLLAHPRQPTDQAVTGWVRTHGWRVAYPVASSWVDHTDGPTLFDHPDHQPRTQPRHAWRTPTPTPR